MLSEPYFDKKHFDSNGLLKSQSKTAPVAPPPGSVRVNGCMDISGIINTDSEKVILSFWK